MIMMGFTKDGQINQKMLKDRDARFNVSTEENKKNRADIPSPGIDPSANAWQSGDVRQLTISKQQAVHH
jgi:hypothetical protein